MTVTPLGRDQDCSLKNREPDVPASWFLDPGGWSKAATVGLYFIFPGICTLSLVKRGNDGRSLGSCECQSLNKGSDWFMARKAGQGEEEEVARARLQEEKKPARHEEKKMWELLRNANEGKEGRKVAQTEEKNEVPLSKTASIPTVLGIQPHPSRGLKDP
ncbi:hypothetical protein STEG23_036893 [Scotinomys teguina]